MNKLKGSVDAIRFRNPQSGWTVLQLDVAGLPGGVSVVGSFLNINVGAVLEIEGDWTVHPKFGQRFEVKSYTESAPANTEGLIRYLSSGFIKGLGVASARKIVEKFGRRSLDIIENDPKQLLKIKGLGKKTVNKIIDSWEKQRALRDIIMFLQNCGATPNLALKIYKQYGDNAISVVKENPYKIADDIWGVGFKTADTIAMGLGFDRKSFVRIRSGTLYTINQMGNEGHCFATRDVLTRKAAALMDVEEVNVTMSIDQMVKDEDLIRDEGDVIYLPSFYYSEIGVAGHIKRLTSEFMPTRLRADIDALAKKQGVEYDEIQVAAIRQALSSKVMVLTGGPGTGKTTVTKGIIAALTEAGQDVVLAAPTGRAAKRMTEATGMESQTIHRLLEYSPLGDYSKNHENPIDGDVLIVDEASMIDIVLMNALLRAMPTQMRLVLIGDVDQLPSVGPGNVLLDIIASGAVPVVRLTTIYRQAMSSKIIMAAHAINEGKFPDLRIKKNSDMFFIEDEDLAHAANQIVDLVQWRLPKAYKVDSADIQVLSPMRKGPLGILELNNMLQNELNPCGVKLERNGVEYRLNDKVMQIKNNYGKGVFNGDIGFISTVDMEEETLSIQYDIGLVEYELSELDEVVLAYATTIHKAQGSEFPIVVMPITMAHRVMLQRNLIYTGITRAKNLLVLVGSKQALGYSIRNVVIKKRNSRLQARLTMD